MMMMKRCPKPFSTIPFIRGNTIYIIRLTPYHWQFCISQFCDITKGLLKISRSIVSSSSSLFQSQRSLKSQPNRKQSMLTIVATGNREEAK